ncbi:Translin family-domain-containing protein [Tuber borchii]|uniref:Translin family-domain-containing protein n=1 Tax=Tuber borchii TaxID=42251 RepID=A0A2T6ZWM1_TUBBO|nr:Translin family-domain-containing protein [Tuber borchii]
MSTSQPSGEPHRPKKFPTQEQQNNPYLSMFNHFRDELDEHHDRRERVIKASRDITALSKKMIFTVQRAREPFSPLPTSLSKEYETRFKQVQNIISIVSPDLQEISTYRYARQISGGIQEYIEAIAFHHYLTTGKLIPLSVVQQSVKHLVEITPGDYILGIFDLVGEMMRFSITMIATRGGAEKDEKVAKALRDLRELRLEFEGLDTTLGGGSGLLGKEVQKKLGVMKTCVEKVEAAMCGVIVRGSERPRGWIPDLTEVAGGRGGRTDRIDQDE